MDSSQNSPASPSSRITLLLANYPVVMQLLKFVAIGFLNTGLSFIVANLVSKYFGIVQGSRLGVSSGVGFLLATLQSYFWNKYWAFGQQVAGLLKNFSRLVLVGLAGILALLLVYLGSQFLAPYYYYIIVLAVFCCAQVGLWHMFGFNAQTVSEQEPAKTLALSFFIVSLVGFTINFVIASTFSQAVHLTNNGDLNKNLALVAATAVSLIWNFIGYKLIVFKK